MDGVERRAPRITRAIRCAAIAFGAGLGTFHLWLLGHQAWSGQLSSPAAIGRWALALALFGGLLVLRRRGLPMLAGRQAVALWLLAALLHGPALVNDHDGFATPAVPQAVVTIAQAAASVGAFGLGLYLWCVWSVWALGAAAGLVTPPDHRLLPRRVPLGALRFLPRPPPLA
jgi:hypothetical protein